MPDLEKRLSSISSTIEGDKLKGDSHFVNRLLGYLFTDLLQYLEEDDP
jgi:hypothetical protein